MAHHHRHGVTELFDKNVLEGFGMLVEQGFDIGVGCFRRLFAPAHCGDAYGCATVVFRIDSENLLIGLHRRVYISGLFKRECAVIGLGERLFVDLLILGHRALSVSVFI